MLLINFCFKETQKAQKESLVQKEGLFLKQKIAQLKNYLVYQIYDKVLVITNSDSANTNSSSNTVTSSADKAESSDNINKRNAETSLDLETKETR